MASLHQIQPHPFEGAPTKESPILMLSHEITVRPFRGSDAEPVAKHGNNKEMWLNRPKVVLYPFTLTDSENYIKQANDSSKWQLLGSSWAGPARLLIYAIAQNDVQLAALNSGWARTLELVARILGIRLGGNFGVGGLQQR